MDAAKRKRLEAKGWKVGDAKELLGLSDAEAAFVELKARLAKAFADRRREKFTQSEVAKRIGSSQSRVAKMEAGDPSVSLDLLVRGFLSLGATEDDLAAVLSARPKPARRSPRRKREAA